MGAPNESAAVAEDFSRAAVSTTQGFLPVRVFRSQKPGVDVCVAWTDGAKSAYAGMLDGAFYVITNDLVRLTISEAGVATFANLKSSADVEASQRLLLSGIEVALIAHAGGTQAAALALSATKSVHVVATVATDADSVKLPASAGSGQYHFVKNMGGHSLQVFGSGTDTIDDVATATGVAQAAGVGAVYIDAAAGKWYRVLGS